MKWERIESKWGEYKLNARMRWRRLSSEQLDRIAGNRQQLVGKICEAYGVSEEEAQLQLAAWRASLREISPFRR